MAGRFRMQGVCQVKKWTKEERMALLLEMERDAAEVRRTNAEMHALTLEAVDKWKRAAQAVRVAAVRSRSRGIEVVPGPPSDGYWRVLVNAEWVGPYYPSEWEAKRAGGAVFAKSPSQVVEIERFALGVMHVWSWS